VNIGPESELFGEKGKGNIEQVDVVIENLERRQKNKHRNA
jgi:hypothetical protein